MSFLWSIDPERLGGNGWAVTLTMGGTPDHSRQWEAARKALVKRLQRAGVTRYQWLTEWTAKGRPHLHMAVYGDGLLSGPIVKAWLEICDVYDWPAEYFAQHIVRIDGPSGWLEYLAKHSSRGVHHYQRMGMPDGWEKTGRLWGKGGEWPVVEPMSVDVSRETFYRFRREVRKYQRAKLVRVARSLSRQVELTPLEDRAKLEARARKTYRAAHRVGSNHGDKEKGRYAGVSGWIPEIVSLTLVEFTGQPEMRVSDYERDDQNECCNHCNCRRQRSADHEKRSDRQNRRERWQADGVYQHACRWGVLHRECPDQHGRIRDA